MAAKVKVGERVSFSGDGWATGPFTVYGTVIEKYDHGKLFVEWEHLPNHKSLVLSREVNRCPKGVI